MLPCHFHLIFMSTYNLTSAQEVRINENTSSTYYISTYILLGFRERFWLGKLAKRPFYVFTSMVSAKLHNPDYANHHQSYLGVKSLRSSSRSFSKPSSQYSPEQRAKCEKKHKSARKLGAIQATSGVLAFALSNFWSTSDQFMIQISILGVILASSMNGLPLFRNKVRHLLCIR